MPARPKLAVIVGAGASYDVCPDRATVKDAQWQPPIVATMFASGAFQQVLAGHPEAAALMSSVTTDVRGGTTFEQSLRRYAYDPNPYIQRQMPFVPIALHGFFLRVSHDYTWEPVNYSHLVNRTIGQGYQTAYITLNYDTLLEMSLYKIAGATFDSVESYISSPDWMLVKLHGSVGWGYPWPTDEWIPNMAAAARSNRPPERRSEEIQVALPPDMYRNGQRRELFYPALALPVVGKSGFVCPPLHVEALKRFLEDCHNFLFIGFSASDDDLLEFLATAVDYVDLLAVVTGKGVLKDVIDRLRDTALQFHGAPPLPNRSGFPDEYGFDTGFTHFLENDIDRVLSSLSA